MAFKPEPFDAHAIRCTQCWSAVTVVEQDSMSVTCQCDLCEHEFRIVVDENLETESTQSNTVRHDPFFNPDRDDANRFRKLRLACELYVTLVLLLVSVVCLDWAAGLANGFFPQVTRVIIAKCSVHAWAWLDAVNIGFAVGMMHYAIGLGFRSYLKRNIDIAQSVFGTVWAWLFPNSQLKRKRPTSIF